MASGVSVQKVKVDPAFFAECGVCRQKTVGRESAVKRWADEHECPTEQSWWRRWFL